MAKFLWWCCTTPSYDKHHISLSFTVNAPIGNSAALRSTPSWQCNSVGRASALLPVVWACSVLWSAYQKTEKKREWGLGENKNATGGQLAKRVFTVYFDNFTTVYNFTCFTEFYKSKMGLPLAP